MSPKGTMGANEAFTNLCNLLILKLFLARPEGLEPPTCRLEGGCSIQLSYGHEAMVNGDKRCTKREMVGAVGFELTTLCSQSRCATRLRYAPTEKEIIAGSREINPYLNR